MNDRRVCSLRVLGLQEYGFIRQHQIDNIGSLSIRTDELCKIKSESE
ncbi:hypothetical protein V7G16_01505 [Enterococcus faecium]